MTDWHSHILPGIDDGPEDAGESVAIASALAGKGFTEVYCTPHLMRGRYEAGNDEVRRGVEELQEALENSGIPITLRSGREYYADEYLLVALEDPLPLGDSRQVLVEIPPNANEETVRRLLSDVVRSGFVPVIAHPERCPLLEPPVGPTGNGGLRGVIDRLLENGRGKGNTLPEAFANPLLAYLRELGCSFQGNLGSFNGFYGGRVQRTAESMRAAGVYDRYGSDLHAQEHAPLVLINSSNER